MKYFFGVKIWQLAVNLQLIFLKNILKLLLKTQSWLVNYLKQNQQILEVRLEHFIDFISHYAMIKPTIDDIEVINT
jgi:hypothetical protein